MSQEKETLPLSFETLGLPISPIVYTYPPELQTSIYQYLSSLNDDCRKAYCIAYEHLGTSFNVERSNGFKQWLLSHGKPNPL